MKLYRTTDYILSFTGNESLSMLWLYRIYKLAIKIYETSKSLLVPINLTFTFFA